MPDETREERAKRLNRERVQRHRDKKRRGKPGRPSAKTKPKIVTRKPAAAGDADPAPFDPVRNTPEGIQGWLGKVRDGLIEADANQIRAAHVQLDSMRRDGAGEDAQPDWVLTERQAAEDLLLARTHHERAVQEKPDAAG